MKKNIILLFLCVFSNYGIAQDTIDPVVYCQNDITVNAASGSCEAFVTYPRPQTSDNNQTVLTLIFDHNSGPLTYTEQNFHFTNTTSSGVHLSNKYTPGTTDMTLRTGQAFTPISVDLSERGSPGVICVTFTGYKLDGSTVTYTFCTDGPVGYQEVVFPETFADLTKLSWGGNFRTFSWQLDNFKVSPDFIPVLTAGAGSHNNFAVGMHIEEWTVTDNSGNSSTCSFNIIVVDNQAPVLSCPDAIIVNSDSDKCGSVVTFNTPIASDNCLPNGAFAQAFYHTGDMQQFVVPLGVNNITIAASGASAGNDGRGHIGGLGAYVESIITVTPGETLWIAVGGAGQNGIGGTGAASGGGGGTFVGRGNDVLTSTPVLVAGGGGGTGWNRGGGNARTVLNLSDAGGIKNLPYNRIRRRRRRFCFYRSKWNWFSWRR